jgi:hypothetical protein
MKSVDHISTDDLLQELARRWNNNLQKITVLNTTIVSLTDERNSLIDEMQSTSKLFSTIRKERPDVKLPELIVPVNFNFAANPNLSIGDAMEMLLRERGPLTQRQMIDAIHEGGLHINSKHPHIVMANAIKRDAKKRFVRLKDGKVGLSKKVADEPR